MSPRSSLRPPLPMLTPVTLGAVSFFYLTVILRTVAESEALGSWLVIYLAVELLYGILYALVLWRPPIDSTWQHLYFTFQSLFALFLLVLHPRLDFTDILLVLLSFQAALAFRDWRRWMWVGVLLALIVLPLVALLGIYGLALSFLPAAVAIVFPGYVVIMQEIQAGQRKQQALLDELLKANERLTAYSGQVDELAAIQERNRLARELHDSVSQTLFSLSLHSRSAHILLERDPELLRSQLERLQELTRNTLEEMRSLISELRPHEPS